MHPPALFFFSSISVLERLPRSEAAVVHHHPLVVAGAAVVPNLTAEAPNAWLPRNLGHNPGLNCSTQNHVKKEGGRSYLWLRWSLKLHLPWF